LGLNIEKLIETVKELVEINSVTEKEIDIVKYLRDKIEGLGYSPIVQRIRGTQANLICVGDEDALMLCGHLDTVDVVEGWERNPFEFRIEGGKAYGLGVADMKSGVAILIHLFHDLYSRLKRKPWLVLTCDEEGCSLGMYNFLEEFNDVKFAGAIFTEPIPGDRIALVDKCFGRYAVDVSVFCGGGHAALKHEEDKMPEIFSGVGRALKELKAFKRGGSIGECDYTVSYVHGGGVFLSIPEKITLRINHICVFGEDLETTLEEVRSAFSSVGLSVEVKPMDRPTPFLEPFDCSSTELSNVFSRFLDRAVSRSVFDGNLTAMRGIPTVNVGPVGGNIHKANEYIEVWSLREVYNVVKRCILAFYHM